MIKKPKTSVLNDEHKFTIRFVLRKEFNYNIEHLNMENEFGGFYLQAAGEAWDAYKAFTGGQTIN